MSVLAGDRVRVLICGAGIAGLTLALCLERETHEVLLVERAPGLRDDGYMIDFFGSGYGAMERLGLLSQLRAIHEPIGHLVILDARGRSQVSVPYAALRKHLFRDRHFNFMRGRLERLLHSRLSESVLRFGTTVDSYHDAGDCVEVRLSDGTREEVDLLVGADGVHSRIRRIAFDARDAVRRLDYEAAAFSIEHPPPLAVGNDLVTVTAPRHQVTLYRTTTGGLATFFLHETGERPRSGVGGAACLILRETYRDFGWIVPDVLKLCEGARSFYFDRVEQVALERWSRGRVVLVGDACQCVSPLAGQGASMAVTGAYLLADHLDHHDLVAGLQAYEAALKPAIARQQAAARRIAQWLVPTSDARLWLRNLFTRASVLPPIAAVLRYQMAAASVFPS